MRKIIVAPLGQKDESQLTLGALEAMKRADRLILRTNQHGVCQYLVDSGIMFESLDELYSESDDFDALVKSVLDRLLSYEPDKTLVYAVPDPMSDETVLALLKSGKAKVTVLPGVNCASDFFAATQAKTEAAYRHMPASAAKDALLNPRESLLITEISTALLAGDVKLWLLGLYPPDLNLCLRNQGAIQTIALSDLDRQKHYDHLTQVFIPPVPLMQRTRYDFYDLVDVLAILRGPNGCPWDREQTHQSLCQYLIEEAYETVSAISEGDMNHVYDELGDVMLQVVFHANIAARHGDFDITDVTCAIVSKMITRHAHIFGQDQCETAEDVLTNWEKIKKKEKGIQSYTALMQDIPSSLPALMRASKVQNKARQVGFDFDSARDALKKVFEEARELMENMDSGTSPDEEMGDLLFSCVNVARKLKIQPELCLAAATEKFINRFSKMENEILLDRKTLEGLTLAEMDVYWERGKSVHK